MMHIFFSIRNIHLLIFEGDDVSDWKKEPSFSGSPFSSYPANSRRTRGNWILYCHTAYSVRVVFLQNFAPSISAMEHWNT